MLKEYKTYFICVLIGVVFGLMLGYLIMPTKIKEIRVPTPVGRNDDNGNDTIYITKDSIIYRTKYIKDIQHDTIEKVRTLDDSTTIDLFYKLVSE